MRLFTSTVNATGWISMGCYTDDVNNRTLSNNVQTNDGDNVTLENCLSACKDLGYDYCGAEYGSQCWGDNEIENNGELTDSGCNITCHGQSTEICGGANRLSLYRNNNLASNLPFTTTTKEGSSVAKTLVTTITLTKSTESTVTTALTVTDTSLGSTVVPEQITAVTIMKTTIVTTISMGQTSVLSITTPTPIQTTGFTMTSSISDPSASISIINHNPASGRKFVLIISIVPAATLAIGLAVLFFYLKRRKSKSNNRGDENEGAISLVPICHDRSQYREPRWADRRRRTGYIGDGQHTEKQSQATSLPPILSPTPLPSSPSSSPPAPLPSLPPSTTSTTASPPPPPNSSQSTWVMRLDNGNHSAKLVRWTSRWNSEFKNGCRYALTLRLAKRIERQEALALLEGERISWRQLSPELQALVNDLKEEDSSSVYSFQDTFAGWGFRKHNEVVEDYSDDFIPDEINLQNVSEWI